MTLIVSTKVPDGIVIAADSVATITAAQQFSAKGKTKCPHCGHDYDFDAPVQIPVGPGVTSTLPYSQKLQDIWAKYGVGTWGSSLIGERTVFAVIRAFQRDREADNNKSLTEIAGMLGDYLHTEIKKHLNVSTIPEGHAALGFQIVGYEDPTPLTISVDIGRKPIARPWKGFGTVVSGDTVVATKLWELKGLGPAMQQPYHAWSLQDAADYCDFLIQTTATYQRFANVIPTVGGEIDIAFVSLDNRFKWIRCKTLASMLIHQEEYNETKTGR